MNAIVRLNEIMDLRTTEEGRARLSSEQPASQKDSDLRGSNMYEPAEEEESKDPVLNLQWKRHNKVYKAKMMAPNFDPYMSQRESQN